MNVMEEKHCTCGGVWDKDHWVYDQGCNDCFGVADKKPEIYRGDIWDLVEKGCGRTLAVIPTNIGWRLNGDAVMGKGLAGQAAKKYPAIKSWYGAYCRIRGINSIPVRHPNYPLIFFATKPLNDRFPHLSWRNGADEGLVRWSLEGLRYMMANHLTDPSWRVAVPLVGAGLGGLDTDLIRQLRAAYLKNPKFIFVDDR